MGSTTRELQLALLGKLEIRLDGQPIGGLTSAKAQALLCYLAVTGRPHFRPTLAGLLWGDMPEVNARANLRRELSVLRRTVGEHLIVTRQEVVFNRDTRYRLDVELFEAATSQGTLARLQEAVELCGGDFLEGFYVREAPAFEEWVLVQQTRLRELALQALHTLTAHYAEQGEAGLREGIQYTSRLLALEPSREEAHRTLMRLLARSGQRGAALAQYEACRQALAEDLGVAPGRETRELYERIRAGELRQPGRVRRGSESQIQKAPTAALPRFLSGEERLEPERPVFVAREGELGRLAGYLERALAGQGQVAFVTGGPGRGKTALMTQFARQAMAQHPELLLGMGDCNAYSGVGDPYLPFREILGMLTGDVETRWAAGAISRAQAQRLWEAVPLTARALLAHGPYLIGTLVPSASLLSRAAATGYAEGWLGQLREWAGRESGAAGDLQQSAIFEQYTNVLRGLAGQRPLLLVLDDLQWTDAASAGLLFHLGRRLAGARILVLGTYRAEEVAVARVGGVSGEQERHPLEKALGEFKRQYGDVWMDLGHPDEQEGRRFVDALLATEPNRLGEAFRRALVKHTAGHALFTVELLQTMQERGDLVRDGEGRWVQGGGVDWGRLPARVEAVIEERMARLSPELRDMLSVASVEGEEFTAQVVARVQGKDERDVFRILSQELGKRHRLVREQGGQTVDGKRLARYRFGHVLFQEYLYSGLSEGERALLHGEVGVALEGLYEGRTEEIAVQLARHFAGAGDAGQERHYAALAGRRAAAQHAHDEALRYLSRALELTPEADHATRYELLLAREEEHNALMDREAQAADLATLELLVDAFEDGQEAAGRRAGVLLRRVRFVERTGDVAGAQAAAQAAVRWARRAQDVEIEAWGYFRWALALVKGGELAGAPSKYERALALAQAAGIRRAELACLRGLGWIRWHQGDWAGAEAYDQQALTIARETLDLRAEGWTLNTLGVMAATRCDYVTADAYSEQAMAKIQQTGWQFAEAAAQRLRGWILRARGDYGGARTTLERSIAALEAGAAEPERSDAIMELGCVLQDLGSYAAARIKFEEALESTREIGTPLPESIALYRLALLSHQRGDDGLALEQGQRALVIAEDVVIRAVQPAAMTIVGHALVSLGQLEEGRDAYRRALRIRQELGQSPLVAEVRAGLARVALARGDAVQALVQVEEILAYLETGSLDGADEPFRVYLTCYRVLRDGEDPRAEEVLTTAHSLLQGRAARIQDEELRRSFLENVAANRAIVREFALRHEAE
jgi:adenylate cyclase